MLRFRARPTVAAISLFLPECSRRFTLIALLFRSIFCRLITIVAARRYAFVTSRIVRRATISRPLKCSRENFGNAQYNVVLFPRNETTEKIPPRDDGVVTEVCQSSAAIETFTVQVPRRVFAKFACNETSTTFHVLRKYIRPAYI